MDIVKNRDFVNNFIANLASLYEFQKTNISNEDAIRVNLKNYKIVSDYQVVYGETPLLRIRSCFYSSDFNDIITRYATKETRDFKKHTTGNSFVFDVKLPSDKEGQIALFMEINRKFKIFKIKI